jgi:hypothetical protein
MKLKINVKIIVKIFIFFQKFHELKIKMKHEIQNDVCVGCSFGYSS